MRHGPDGDDLVRTRGLALRVLLACALLSACGGDGKPAGPAVKPIDTKGKASEPAKTDDPPAKADTAAKADDGAAKADDAGGKADDAGGKADGGKADDAGASADGGTGAAAGAKSDEGKSDEGDGDDAKAGDTGAPVDAAALQAEIKQKKTTDERALAALAELEASGAKLRDVAKAAHARGEKLFAEPERAKTFFEWAAAKDPKYPDPMFSLAKQSVMVGDIEVTREHLKQVKARGGKKLLAQIEFDPTWEIVKDDPEVRKLLGG